MKIKTNTRGAAAGVACTLGHSGKQGLYESQTGYWQCAGCTTFYTASEVAAMQADPRNAGDVWRESSQSAHG